MRDAWDAAIASGANAIVASGNTMLWRVRMIGRTMFCYKDSHIRRTAPARASTRCRGPVRGVTPAGRHRRAENESIGTVFVANGIRNDAIAVPTPTMATEPTVAGHDRRRRSVAGPVETLKAACPRVRMGHASSRPTRDSMRYPPGLKFLSQTAVNLTSNACQPERFARTRRRSTRATTASSPSNAARRSSSTSAPTNGAGDCPTCTRPWRTPVTNTTMKQATVNLLADMDCQPVDACSQD